MLRIRVPAAIAFSLCVLIWGGSWLAIRASVTDTVPIGGAALRTSLAAAICLGLAWVLRLPAPSRRTVLGILGGGLVFIGANYAVVYWSAPQLPTSLSALLYASAPLQAVILSPWLSRRDAFRWPAALGALLGAVGILLAFRSLTGFASATVLPILLLLLGATTSAAGAALLRRFPDVHPVWLNAFTNASGAALLFTVSLVAEDGPMIPSQPKAWAGFAYMLLAGSLLAFLLYYQVLQEWDATRASFTAVLTPFVSLALAVGVAHEPVTGWVVLGGVLVAVAGFLVLRERTPDPHHAANGKLGRAEVPLLQDT